MSEACFVAEISAKLTHLSLKMLHNTDDRQKRNTIQVRFVASLRLFSLPYPTLSCYFLSPIYILNYD